MRCSLICYIINLRRNSLCQVKETKWESQFRNNDGDIPVRGSGNYQSEDAKEIAHLKRELRDAQDALDVLKKAISILEKS